MQPASDRNVLAVHYAVEAAVDDERRSILQHIGRTPLVALQRITKSLPVPVLVKCEHLNSGGSIKDRIALAIVDDAETRGVLRAGMTFVEAAAGNTGMGLATESTT